MKIKTMLAAMLLAASSAAIAAEGQGEGTVNKVNSDEEKLNITHGPIEGVMDGMTMDFKVLDPSMLSVVEPGDKISFTVEEDGGQFVITDLEVAGKGDVASH